MLALIVQAATLPSVAPEAAGALRAPRVGMLLFPAVVGTGMLMMHVTGGSFAGLFITAAVRGFGFGGVPTTVLSWGARSEPSRLEQIGGLIVMVCNIGMALGAAGGGILVDGISARAPLAAGGVTVVVGAAILVTLRPRVAAYSPTRPA